MHLIQVLFLKKVFCLNRLKFSRHHLSDIIILSFGRMYITDLWFMYLTIDLCQYINCIPACYSFIFLNSSLHIFTFIDDSVSTFVL